MAFDIARSPLIVVLFTLWVIFPHVAHADACRDLSNLKLTNTQIKSADLIAAGKFVGPGAVTHPDLPAFCRVIASVKADTDSEILVELWLPVEHWAGVFHGNGSGGFGGSLAAGYAGMEEGLRRGYASAVTDTGTAPATSLNGDPLIGHPRKWKDWGMLSTHVMTVTGKSLVKAFYGADARRAYYTGCSTGGQQGLIEAQYFPQDYDGILVGAPVINRTWGHALAVWDWLAANREPESKLSDAKLTLLNKAAVAACGGKGNGLASDPFIADAFACKFDPAELTCKDGESDNCLTPAQVRTARDFYSGPTDKNGRPVFYGWLRGSEAPGRLGWGFLETPPNNEPAFDGLFKWVFGANWEWTRFDFARDMPKVDVALGPSVNGATKGDLAAFRARGGKLVIYQGLADALVAPEQTLDFYRAQEKKFGVAQTESFARLFFAPGVMHCGGGDGPNAFNTANGAARKPPGVGPDQDIFSAMIHWVENDAAPTRIIATKYVEDIPAKGIVSQRPLCPWPQKAWYTGGETRDPRNFTCAAQAPKR